MHGLKRRLWRPWARVAVGGILLLMAAVIAVPLQAQEQTVGLFLNSPEAYGCYTLFAPMPSQTTYLIDNGGLVVHTWESDYEPGLGVYLLEDGSLLRTGQYAPAGVSRFTSAGAGGRVQIIDWNGVVNWDYVYSSDKHRQHHDVEILPSGNVLIVAWDYKTSNEAVAAGRDPQLLPDGEVWPLHLVEVEPVGTADGNIVWEWHVWDHLVQDLDPTKGNFGIVADHPELVDVNYDNRLGPKRGGADWNHTNSVAYSADLDQIVLSIRTFSEIWIIDHSTTTAEAAGHSGGDSGRGGDLLYRWGNPQTYDRGGSTEQRLFRQHDARWIEAGTPGAGNIQIFNNGTGRPDGDYSSVDEIAPPIDGSGDYILVGGAAYGPDQALWRYAPQPPDDFYAPNISGAERLPNGNMLVCDGPNGAFFEVNPENEEVWRYVSPVTSAGIVSQGESVHGNSVFRALRFPFDYPGFIGRDLAADSPLELFDAPYPAPGGAGSTEPITISKITSGGDWVNVQWDTESCTSDDYKLLYGDLVDVSTYALQGSQCAIGSGGSFDWSGVPAGDLFFVVVGVDGSGVYESSWGVDGAIAERGGTNCSNTCGSTTKVVTTTCPGPGRRTRATGAISGEARSRSGPAGAWRRESRESGRRSEGRAPRSPRRCSTSAS